MFKWFLFNVLRRIKRKAGNHKTAACICSSQIKSSTVNQ